MEVRLARQAGFCFGVKNAIKMAQEEAKKGKTLYTLGPLIHNKQVVEQLEVQGIKAIDELQDIEEGTIVIRSHGVPPQIIELAKEKKLKIVDATCPFVSKAQKLAKQLAEDGYKVIVVGDKKHPEVVGIVGWANGSARVIEDPQMALKIDKAQKIGVVAQTTQPLGNFKEIIKNLAEISKELRVYNTICHATSERQLAAEELASQVDCMIVVGGHNSANTRKLANLCKDTGTTTYHVETAEDLQEAWFEGSKVVGITSGA